MKTASLLNIFCSPFCQAKTGDCARGLRRRAVGDGARVRIRFARAFLVGRAECFPPEDLSLAASFAANAGIASMRIIRSTSLRGNFFRTHGTIMRLECPGNPLVGLRFL